MSNPNESSPRAGHEDNHHEHHHGALGGHVHATGTKLKWAFFATFLILVVEVVGGSLANSLALLSDAGHVLTDVAALGHCMVCSYSSAKGPNP